MKRQVTPQEVAAAQRLDVPGLGVAKEPKRFYPQRELGAQVLGVVGTDGHGLEGLELAFEDELSGQSEKLQGTRDARGRNLLLQGTPETAGRQGATVTLTLDRQVQYVAEKALDRAVEESKAIGGMLVVLDPRTGELLAIAQSPRFNPNAPAPGSPPARSATARRWTPSSPGAPTRPSSPRPRSRTTPSGPRTPSTARAAAGRSAATSSTTPTHTGC